METIKPVSSPNLFDAQARIEREHQHAEAEPEREHDPDHRVALALAQAEQAEHHAGHHGSDDRTQLHADPREQRRRATGERQLGDVHARERHPARDDQRRQQPGDEPEHRAGDQRRLHERQREQLADTLERDQPTHRTPSLALGRHFARAL